MIRQITFAVCLCASALGLVGCQGGTNDADLTKSARAYLDKKDTRAAVIQLKNALGKNPNSPEARFLLGKALLMTGDASAAMVELRKAQELKHPEIQILPELARAMLALGEGSKVIEQFSTTRLSDDTATADIMTSVALAHAMSGDADKALEATASALLAKPGYAPATIMQAQLAAAGNKPDEALALLDTVLAGDPNNERAGVLRGDLLYRIKKDLAGATEAYRKVLVTTPDSLGAHIALIGLLGQSGKAAEAKEQFLALKKALPNHPETSFYEAQLAFTELDYKKSREITDKLLKFMPENVRVLELAGAADYRLGQFLTAQTFLAKALKNAPGQLLSRHLLTQSYLRSGQPAKALEVLQPVIGGKSADGPSLALAGEAYLQMGDAKNSAAAFKAAKEADPGNTRVQTAAALAQVQTGNPKAIAELEAIAAGDAGTRADLGLIAATLRQNDFAAALKAIDGLEKKMPQRALPHGLRGQVLIRKRDLEGAKRSFEVALTMEPSYFPAVASLAALELSAGQPELARKRFEAFSKANPRSYEAMLALAEIGARTGAPVSEVTKFAREAVKANPAEPKARLVLVEHLLSTGEAKVALVAAQEANATMQNNPEITEIFGRALMASGDAQQSVSVFKKLAAQLPDNPRLQIRLAEALLMSKDNAGAQAALKRAEALQPDYLPAQRGLVLMAMLEKRYAEAVTMTRSMQTKNPKSPLGLLLEGDIESSRKSFDAAATAYRSALQITKSTETSMKLHNSLLAGNKRAEADRWAADWLKDNPKDASFRFYLGDITLARGDDAGAEVHYRSVLELQPENALAMNNVAWLLVKQGKPGGLPMAQKAVSLLNDRAPLLDTLAAALAADNQLSKAIETQKRAIELDADSPMLKFALAKHYLKAGEKAYAKAELEALSKLGDKFSAQAEVGNLLKTL